jgi:ABC-type phosphate transport system substrate-binding protein
MNTNTSLFFTPLVRKRKALSQPVAAIILVVIVTSLALIVGVLTMARIGVFARSESIRVIEAQAYLQGSGTSTCIYVNAKVKNDGSTTITGVQVTARWGNNTQSVGSIGNLVPGAEASAAACVPGLGAGRGDLIIVEASGTGSGGTIRHSTSVPVV